METNLVHWSISAVKKTIAEHGDKKLYTIASGVTPSGTIHIGNFREIITVDLVKRAFKLLNLPVRHIHSWDENDVFRKVPANMPNQEMLQLNLRKCIVDIPDPFGIETSYAQKHISDVENSLPIVGIKPNYIYQSKKYRSCDYAEQIKTALEKTDVIKEILNEYRKEPLSDSWLPVSIFCSKCQKDTITKLNYLGEYTLSYDCECGNTEEFDFRKVGIAKLLWRVDWPMRWKYEDVCFEPGGKDHSTDGGSFSTGKTIIERVWNSKPPTYIMYDFIKIKGAGGKISSSGGNVITLSDCLEIYEPELIRYLFAGTRPNTEFSISFDTDVIKIYEDFDKCERVAYGVDKTSEKEQAKQKLIYDLSQVDENLNNLPKEMPIQINFRHITTILQSNDMDETATFDFLKNSISSDLGSINEKRLKCRINCAKNWIDKYADEQFCFKVKQTQDKAFFSSLNELELSAIDYLHNAVISSKTEEDLANMIFEIPKLLDISMKDFFKLAYTAIIGKESGPKLASFIMGIGVDRVSRLLSKDL